jgi:hypothetical protein
VTRRRERPAGIDVGGQRITVVHQIQPHDR